MPPTNALTSESSFHVRYAETDAMGIVHHASYIVYFELGRSDYIRERGHSYADFERSGFYLAVSEVNARYVRPAVYDQSITVCAWVAKLQSRGMTFAYEIIDTETRETLVTGETKHICIDKSGAIKRIPDEWRGWVLSEK